ncbi:MAG: tetratricopeptide repeat protein [Candidatus Krumholzibacteria bacterium]
MPAAMSIHRTVTRLTAVPGVLAFLLLAPITVAAQTGDPGRGATVSTDRPSDPAATVVDTSLPTRELIERARTFVALGNYAAAEAALKGILIREPDNVTAMLELATIYETLGKLQYAMGLLNRATLAKPYDATIIDRHREVVTKLSQRLELDVDSLMSQGAYELAVPKLTSLLTAQPENAELYYLKAHCYMQLGRPDVARSEVAKALNLGQVDKYFELQEKAADAVRELEVRELVAKAEALLPATNPAAKEEVLGHLAQILELDPAHQWANKHFDALAGSTGGGPRGPVTTHLTAFGAQVSRVFKRIGRGIVDLLALFYRHREILLTILLLFFVLNSPFTHMLIRGFSPRLSLTGQLRQFTIHEVLTLLNTHQSTGALKLKTPSMKGRIFFEDGEIYHCKCKGNTGRKALQELLENSGEGFFVFTEAVQSSQKTVDTPLSLILMELPERSRNVTSKSIIQQQKRKSRMKTLLGSKR